MRVLSKMEQELLAPKILVSLNKTFDRKRWSDTPRRKGFFQWLFVLRMS